MPDAHRIPSIPKPLKRKERDKKRTPISKLASKSDLSHIAESLRPLAIPCSSLNLDPDNARLHGEENIEAIMKSLAEFGQDQPLVVQKQGMIVRKGNGRLLAAQRLGWEWDVIIQRWENLTGKKAERCQLKK